ncbi:L-threonylcarbamoyladenylate synthase [Croceitalea sp. MTPC5]|uniref:L-threonylcarbamoyladenylate synthase n=1 Tax=Croceitalea sp. MTPC5 TaxID=3056565 RepID=UPI002B378545|nr:L-threonylcarbamoyladenylate synthase [Croceitalea sp. MTPC5]
MAIITKNIQGAKTILDDGGLVAIPTETVYGLAAKGTDPDALASIFKTKGRPSNNPLILHFSDFKTMEPYVKVITDEVRLLANTFWPGPLTLLLPKTAIVPDVVTAGLPRVAVRIPDHKLTLGLLKKLDYPLAAPSANPSGYISPTKPSHVNIQLGDKIPMILDGGNCEKGLESTILGWNDDGIPTIYRKGIITKGDLETVLNKEVCIYDSHSQTLEAPGMLSSHYAPNTRTLLSSTISEKIDENKHLKIGLISFKNAYEGDVAITKEIVLSSDGALDEVAYKLYAAMRELDGLGLDVLLIEKVPDTGIGEAINDRLTRSAITGTE